MTNPQEKRITGRISIGALRKATKRAERITQDTASIDVEVWDYMETIEEESIRLWLSSEQKSYYFNSMDKLNTFLDEYQTK